MGGNCENFPNSVSVGKNPMRILALFCGAFSAGIFAAQYLIPHTLLLPLGAAAFLLACARFLISGDIGRRLLLIGVGLSLAFGYRWLYARQTVQSLAALYGASQTVSMTLCDYPDETAWGARVSVRIDGIPGRVAYYGKRDLLDLSPGAVVRDSVRFQDARQIRESAVTSFTSRGVFALAYGRGRAVIEDERGAASVRWYPVRAGRVIRDRIMTLFPADVAPFLSAALVGDRDGLSVSATAELSEAGLSHVLAVSGMHCGFLIAFIGVLLGRRRRFLVAAIGIPILIFYALLTGAKPSVIRACVMWSLLLFAPLVRRNPDPLTALSFALFVILVQNPFAAASISLQLSFASVAGLLSLTPKLYAFFSGDASSVDSSIASGDATNVNSPIASDSASGVDSPIASDGAQNFDSSIASDDASSGDSTKRALWKAVSSRLRRVSAATFSASLGAIALTAPLSAVYFGVLSLIAPLSNLLCLWAVGGAFAFGLLSVALSSLSIPAALVAAHVPAFLIRYILLCAHGLSKFPFHAVYFANPFLKYWLVYAYALFALAYLVKPRGGRKYALAAALAVLTLCATVCAGYSIYRGGLDALTLDVGQGQSVILASHGRYALVDCGSSNSWKDAGTIAGQQLRSMGCRRLDALILTHYDSDHVNGLASLLVRVPVRALYVPEASEGNHNHAAVLALADYYRIPVHTIRERVGTDFGAAHLTLYPPVGTGDGNDFGLSILASVGGTDFLITGDMGQDAERELIARYALPDLEALIAGHHGSKYATSEELLTALTPETVCVSVGSNSYGHPTPETLRRLSDHGCAVYRTDLDGTIHLVLNAP